MRKKENGGRLEKTKKGRTFNISLKRGRCHTQETGLRGNQG